MGTGRGIAKGIAIGVKSIIDEQEKKRKNKGITDLLTGASISDTADYSDMDLDDISKLMNIKSKQANIEKLKQKVLEEAREQVLRGRLVGNICRLEDMPAQGSNPYEIAQLQRQANEDRNAMLGMMPITRVPDSPLLRPKQPYEFTIPIRKSTTETTGVQGDVSSGSISPYQQERITRNFESINNIKNQVGGLTVGWGSLLSKVPATQARALQADVNTLKANIGFGELTAMREASKTGGALGQVSDRELNLLTSALGSLDTAQSQKDFLDNLQQIENSLNRWKKAINTQQKEQQIGQMPERQQAKQILLQKGYSEQEAEQLLGE